MPDYRLESAYLADGWHRGAIVSVAPDGFITHIRTTERPLDGTGGTGGIGTGGTGTGTGGDDAEYVAGIVVPGMPNAHSHAFQRAMAGDTEFRLSAQDSFWTWRQAMYGLANRIEPDELQVVATQLYVDMLKAGYTAVAEFNYLHRQRSGHAYAGANALWDALDAAAQTAGIGLTLLPTLYQTSDFGAKPLKPEQLRFSFETDAFLRAVESEVHRDRGTRRTGVAFHSLRAVPLDNLRAAAAGLRAIDAAMPLHIHVAEQLLEVDACQRETGRRPLELLLDTGLVDEHWCLVHATHATHQELAAVAASRAVVCVSISTEANLGDGFFDTRRFLELGGRLCVGSDSHATVDPTEELRWLEYQERLRETRRGVLADAHEPHVGTLLWRAAAAHGAAALGQPIGSIEVGRRADWVVLDAAHPTMAGGALHTSLDRLLFAGGRGAIRHTMVAGKWVVRDGRHAADERLRTTLGPLLARFAAEG
jgi:formimidoylglutamate deiminase